MKSILITGGTGSFGRAFVQHLLDTTDCERICIFSRGEHIQAQVREAMGDNARLRFFIGDVRDRWRLTRAAHRVDVIVHAAALKRIEVGFYNPIEMVRTNIEGAINVVEAARDAGVKKVVGLSTDKAYQPISPYGQSKALAERIFFAANDGHGPAFSVTRYGNVWNSAGSVYPTWRRILASGASTVPITDPDCTRFFMYMREAVELVCSAISGDRDLYIPTLPAYRLGTIAEALGVKYNVIGLPEWEKKHESMGAGNDSSTARKLTVDELRTIIAETNASTSI